MTIAIYGEANTNPAAPSATDGDLSARTPTAASVMWQPEPSDEVGQPLSTPDISSIVREIISLDGWTSGNSMGILFGHTAGSGVRWVESSSSLTNADYQMDGIHHLFCVPSSFCDRRL